MFCKNFRRKNEITTEVSLSGELKRALDPIKDLIDDLGGTSPKIEHLLDDLLITTSFSNDFIRETFCKSVEQTLTDLTKEQNEQKEIHVSVNLQTILDEFQLFMFSIDNLIKYINIHGTDNLEQGFLKDSLDPQIHEELLLLSEFMAAYIIGKKFLFSSNLKKNK